jgi:hypothetical protein
VSKLLLWEQFSNWEPSVHLVAYVCEDKAERLLWQVLVSLECLAGILVEKSVDRVTCNAKGSVKDCERLDFQAACDAV